MHITFILPGYPWYPSGGYKVVYEYANALSRRNHFVTIIHPYEIHPYLPPDPKSLKLLKLPLRNLFKWRRQRTLVGINWQAIEPNVKMVYLQGEPLAAFIPDGDVVIATAWETAQYVSTYPESKGLKFHHVADYERWITATEQQKQIMSQAFKLPLIKLAISNAAASMLGECTLTVQEDMPIYIVPLAIDHSTYYCRQPVEARSPYSVGMAYRTASHKGMEDGFEALRMVKAKYSKLQVQLFGGVKLKHKLESWMDYWFRPSNEGVTTIYNNCSIFVVPSRAEGWGLPGMEAMACGAALCSTKTGGVNEYAVNGVDALISHPNDPDMLAENIIHLINDDQLRSAISTKGMSSIKRFNWKNSTNIFENALKCSMPASKK